jgi:acetylornithine deacetylase/succinyl-diaminopimelate desuccinylase-like protein
MTTQTSSSTSARTADYAAFDRYIEEHLDGWIQELAEYCAIGSEASDPAALRAAAAWTAGRLRRLGAEVDVVELEGVEPEVPPLVVGTIGRGRMLNAVQHYDVQPGVPLELWTTGPYQPEVRDGRLYARGSADDKGEFLVRVWAIEAYLATIGELPCRVRFLVEGEEEGGGEHLGALLDQRPGLRDADGALIEGGGIDVQGRPQVVGGVRGMVEVELIARTISYDAHSSLSNLLPNAGVRLVQALATLWDANGVPAVEGLDAGILAPTQAQLDVLSRIPADEVDDLREQYGIDQFVAGRSGLEALTAMTLNVTCNLQGLWSGYTGPGAKTITPAEAHARLDIRLVPEQDPDTVFEALQRHLRGKGFEDIEVVRIGSGYRAQWTPPDHPIIAAAIRVSEEILGKPAIHDLSSPGTAPMWEVCGRGNVPMTSLGGADDGARYHAPDEGIRIDYAAAATRMTGRFLDEFARIPLE